MSSSKQDNTGRNIIIGIIILAILIGAGVAVWYFVFKKVDVTITINPAKTTARKGDTINFSTTVIAPNKETITQKVTWSVNDKNLGNIDENGNFNAISNTGTVTVTATSQDNTSKSATATVTLTSAIIEPSTITELATNTSLDPTGTPVKMMCANGSYVTSVYGNSNTFIDKIGLKCSDGSTVGPFGIDGGTPYNISNSDGFGKIELEHGKWNVSAMDLFDKNNKLIGKKVGQHYSDGKIRPSTCPENEILVGIHGDYADHYKRVGIICRKK